MAWNLHLLQYSRQPPLSNRTTSCVPALTSSMVAKGSWQQYKDTSRIELRRHCVWFENLKWNFTHPAAFQGCIREMCCYKCIMSSPAYWWMFHKWVIFTIRQLGWCLRLMIKSNKFQIQALAHSGCLKETSNNISLKTPNKSKFRHSRVYTQECLD